MKRSKGPEPGPAAVDEGPPALLVEGLGKSYDGKPVLEAVGFSIPRGQICGYLGPNGAGKSTTIKILTGLLRPDAGRASILGHGLDTAPLAAKSRLGYVPESGALYTLLTAREHLQLVADLHELPEDRAGARIETVLEQFDLTGLADRRIDSLSKGQRQKVLLGTALLHEPEVLLLDEPLDGLDASSARRLKDLLRQLAAQGATILFCSHILDVVERICDRAIILNAGRIVADAPTRELVARSRDRTLESVFESLVNSADVEGLAGAFTDPERGSG